MGLIKIELDSDAHIHLKRFIKFLRYQDKAADQVRPSVGALLYNPEIYSDQNIIDLYIAWLEAGEPEA